MPLEISRRRFLAGTGAAFALGGSSILFAQARAAIPAPDREMMVPVEGGRIYVRVNGPLTGPRPPLLMIHGGPGSSHAAFLNALPLAGERAVILYDQLDSGRSDRPDSPANWRVARFVDEVDAIRRALGLARLHVFGTSWGGTIAIEYAARRPSGLASTVLQSPLVSTRSWLADANALRRTLPSPTQAMLDRCERPRPPSAKQCSVAETVFNDRYLNRERRPPEHQAYIDRLPMPFNQRIYETMWGKTEFVSTGSLRHYNGEPLLARLDGPRTFFVTGQYDEARPATVAEFSRRVPGADFAVIPGAAHRIFNDRPEPMQFLLERWMRRTDAA